MRRRSGGDVSKLFVGVGPFVHNPEIELLDVPVLRLIKVFYAHAYVVAAPACERRSGLFWGEFEIAHNRSPVLAAGFCCWPLADIFKHGTHVRFRTESGHGVLRCICRLMT